MFASELLENLEDMLINYTHYNETCPLIRVEPHNSVLPETRGNNIMGSYESTVVEFTIVDFSVCFLEIQRPQIPNFLKILKKT